MEHSCFILSNNQKQLKMYESHFNKNCKIIKVVKETKLYYFMENGEQVYKSSGYQKCRRYPHIYHDAD